MDPSTYLRLATPLVLSVPVLRLIPAPPEPQAELPGIRPITVRIVTPRRSFILLTLTLLAITSVLDAARLIIEIATSQARDRIVYGLPLWSEVAYAFGGLSVWALTAIFIEWRAKWGDRGLISLGVLGLLLEIPNVVFAVLRQVHDNDIFHILAIPPPAVRLLLLPLLISLVSRPIIRYEAAETSSLLPESTTEYGTFEGNQPKRPNIPKKLGEIKKEDKPLTWGEIWSRLRKLSPHLWPSTSKRLQLYVVLCMVCILIGRVASPVQPIILGRVVNQLIDAQNGLPAKPLIPFAEYIGVRLSLGSSGVLTFINNVLWVRVAQYTDREMQMLCFNHLLNLSLAYHTKRNTGEVLKIIDRGSAINNLFQTLLFTAIPTVLDIIISFGVFYFLFGPLLACVTFLVMCTYVVFSVTQTNWRMRLRRVMVDKDVKTRGIVSDVLTNWESVKYFTAEDRESRRFRESIISYQETEAKVQIGFNLLFFIQYFLLTLGLALGALIVAFRVINGQADAASFVVFTQYYAQLQGPLNNFGWLYRIFNQETTDAEKMFTLLAETTEVNDKPEAKELVVTDGVIEFDNVTFSYDGKVDALRGVSFRLGKGESLALVGESGSGKSTILRLLYRFYDITSGRILIDGQDISQVTQLSLRRAIGIVPQDSVLWNDTIGANISYGKEGSDDDAIIAAAQAARLHDRIMGFPEQYETVVGERGVRLSGGEKQRVSLARMFLKSPAILVLDEATSALDTETEREIQKALADLAKGRSSLSIAHRLSTIINSDQIVVMRDGQVIELGGYKELLEKDGIFAMMWKKQIFTDAEILAQSGLNTAAQSGETTPKPSSPSSRGSVKGKEKAVPDEGQGAEVDVPSVQVTPDEHGNTEDVVTAGDALDQPIAGDIARDEELVEAAAARIEQQPEDNSSAAHSGVQGKGDREAGTSAQNVSATDNEATKGYVVEPESYADAVKMSPTTEEVVDPVTPAVLTSVLVPEQPAQTPSSQTAETIPTPSRPPSTSRLSFPPMPRTSSHHSGLSNTSEHDGPSTPGSITEEGGDKRRKRLSSLKGFVRRISDQGVTRSNSFKNFMSGDSPRSSPVQLDETAPLIEPTAEQPGASLPSPAAQPAWTSAGGQNGQGKKKNKKKGRK